MVKHFKLLILLVITLSASGFLLFFLQKYQNNTSKEVAVTVPSEIKAASQETSQVSPDGKELLTLKREDTNTLVNYSFTTLHEAHYEFSDPKTTSVSIPFNTWSPDDKYFFFKENDQYIIISPKGEATNVNEAFKLKYPDLIMGEATGWAANTLLVINSNKSDGSKGYSYWYDLSSHSFIQLSNRFN